MQFTVLPPRTRPAAPRPGEAFLVRDDWDDYHFKTTFALLCVDESGRLHEVGLVKIGRFGMTAPARTSVPEDFETLDEAFFSLGQDDTYYESLRDLGDDVRSGVLRALNDVAFNQDLFGRAIDEAVMETSLLRTVAADTVWRQFNRIAHGGERLRPFHFSYLAPRTSRARGERLELAFEVDPASSPSTNIHALIGSNAVGKTRLLRLLARAVAEDSAPAEDVGEVVDYTGEVGPPFTNMVSIASSAFDPSYLIRRPKGITHAHVTLTQWGPHGHTPEERFETVVATLSGARLERWEDAIATLAVADPLFSALGVLDAGPYLMPATDDTPGVSEGHAGEIFSRRSSGHKIVLLAITHLADLVTERTLVLIDEPETHLHPPLLAAFMRVLSDLLSDRNGVAIVATHSPVVLQETPARCVYKLRRSGNAVRADRPAIETFGENVGILTHEVFGLEVTRSGFHRDVQTAVDKGMTYQEVLRQFGGQLGGEAKSLARALIAVRDSRNDS
ncbi:AAA family ATPase [Streptomyces sp. NPDC051907]|uniref:ATP-dependent nuclease n=1 Tax=Streptomyces sp. NPDC051907 TaxID=3155284 RepID=UPI003445F4E3